MLLHSVVLCCDVSVSVRMVNHMTVFIDHDEGREEDGNDM